MKTIRVMTICAPLALTLMAACGGTKGQLNASEGAEEGAKATAVAEFTGELVMGLSENPGIVSATDIGGLEATYTVTLASGRTLSIRRQVENNQTLGESRFDSFQTSTVEPQPGKDASCLKQGLVEIEAAGYEPRYVGILFSESTMYFGYSKDAEGAYVSFDLATAKCSSSLMN